MALVGQGLGRGAALVGHGQVAGHQQQGAEGHGLARAENTVGQHAADQRQQVDQGGVGAVLGAGELVAEQEVLGQVEDQDPAHPVVGEPLPHLGEEQDHQAPGVVGAQLEEDRQARQDGDEHPQDHDDIVHMDSRPAASGMRLPELDGRGQMNTR